MNISLNSQLLQLPEESLPKVQGLLPPEHLVSKEKPQGGYVGTAPGNVNNLWSSPLLLITLHSQSFQLMTNHIQQAEIQYKINFK